MNRICSCACKIFNIDVNYIKQVNILCSPLSQEGGQMTNQNNNSARESNIRIHIDRDPYNAQSPLTGIELYKLADISHHRDLFWVRGGNQEDQLIPRDDTEIHLKQDDHLYSQKEITIVVNGRERTTSETKLSFDEIVRLAFETPPYGAQTLFTITYRKGHGENHEGTLVEGQTVKTKKGMVINVTATDKS